MKKTSSEKKQSQEKIEHALNLYEKENEYRKTLSERMEKENNDYLQQSIDIQRKYKEDLHSIIKIKNVETCEKFINKIANDIPRYITMDETYPLLKELTESTEGEHKKINEIDLEDDNAIKALLSDDQRDRLKKLQDGEKQIKKKSQENFKIMIETIYPSLILSRDKRDFLWNLATWKSNLLLTKQMKNYTYLVMILTGVVVFFTILLVIVSLINNI
ncbi:MAG: hypothetical protein NTZ75_00980 [Euryarchaeota archaeon]|nr:hypothetical protein [Euryarchaeota archaeon]